MRTPWNPPTSKTLTNVGADGVRPKKASIALTLLLTVVFSDAQAKLAPAKPQVSAISRDDATIYIGPSGYAGGGLF